MNTMNPPLAIGDFVRCSDGTPPPPAHHKKKLGSWKCRNFTGWVEKIEPGYGVGIDQTGSGILVNMVRFADYTITKETPPGSNAATPPAVKGDYRKSTSPWGKVDHHSPFGDLGFHHHSTPGHGGIYVPDEMLRLMPKPYREANGYAGRNWFEEDAEWALVALSFPSGLDAKKIEAATRTVKSYYPRAYMAVTGEKLTRQDSHTLAKEEDAERAKNLHVVVAAWGSWYKDRSPIPDGMVGCYAVIGGRDDSGSYTDKGSRYLLVPEVEYNTRSPIGFIVEKDYPAWPMLGEEAPVAAAPNTTARARKPRLTPEQLESALSFLAA